MRSRKILGDFRGGLFRQGITPPVSFDVCQGGFCRHGAPDEWTFFKTSGQRASMPLPLSFTPLSFWRGDPSEQGSLAGVIGLPPQESSRSDSSSALVLPRAGDQPEERIEHKRTEHRAADALHTDEQPRGCLGREARRAFTIGTGRIAGLALVAWNTFPPRETEQRVA